MKWQKTDNRCCVKATTLFCHTFFGSWYVSTTKFNVSARALGVFLSLSLLSFGQTSNAATIVPGTGASQTLVTITATATRPEGFYIVASTEVSVPGIFVLNSSPAVPGCSHKWALVPNTLDSKQYRDIVNMAQMAVALGKPVYILTLQCYQTQPFAAPSTTYNYPIVHALDVFW
jgi:hypothetical protein